MEKRTVIAILLCLLIVLYYPHYLKKFSIEKKPVSEVKTGEIPLITEEEKSAEAHSEEPILTPSPITPEEELTVTTPLMDITFSSYDAVIKQLVLNKYTGRDKLPLKLVSPVDTLSSPIYTSLAQETVNYKITRNDYTITCIGTVKNLKIIKTFIIDPESYVLKTSLLIENKGQNQFHIPGGYNICTGTVFPGGETQGGTYLDAKTLIDGRAINTKLGRHPFIKTLDGRIFWNAVKNKYFVLILKPAALGIGVTVKDYKSGDGMTGVTSSIHMQELIIPAGGSHTENFILYAGPKEYTILKNLGSDMDDVMDFGKLEPISKVTLTVLNFFYRICRNYGVAIILLTILVRIILYPLTLKSYKSMREMHRVQPFIEELRKKFKDDPKRLQKEIMLLYKEHKVNPLGGCLPVLLQMPILIALFTTLRSAIELRGAPFVLWIKDLSEPDTLFRLPNGFAVNVLPILMVGAFYVQQKMTVVPAASEQQAQQQKMMSKIMPIFMGFIFYNMPSGLVLYFTLSTALGIYDQYRIQRMK